MFRVLVLLFTTAGAASAQAITLQQAINNPDITVASDGRFQVRANPSQPYQATRHSISSTDGTYFIRQTNTKKDHRIIVARKVSEDRVAIRNYNRTGSGIVKRYTSCDAHVKGVIIERAQYFCLMVDQQFCNRMTAEGPQLKEKLKSCEDTVGALRDFFPKKSAVPNKSDANYYKVVADNKYMDATEKEIQAITEFMNNEVGIGKKSYHGLTKLGKEHSENTLANISFMGSVINYAANMCQDFNQLPSSSTSGAARPSKNNQSTR